MKSDYKSESSINTYKKDLRILIVWLRETKSKSYPRPSLIILKNEMNLCFCIPLLLVSTMSTTYRQLCHGESIRIVTSSCSNTKEIVLVSYIPPTFDSVVISVVSNGIQKLYPNACPIVIHANVSIFRGPFSFLLIGVFFLFGDCHLSLCPSVVVKTQTSHQMPWTPYHKSQYRNLHPYQLLVNGNRTSCSRGCEIEFQLLSKSIYSYGMAVCLFWRLVNDDRTDSNDVGDEEQTKIRNEEKTAKCMYG